MRKQIRRNKVLVSKHGGKTRNKTSLTITKPIGHKCNHAHLKKFIFIPKENYKHMRNALSYADR